MVPGANSPFWGQSVNMEMIWMNLCAQRPTTLDFSPQMFLCEHIVCKLTFEWCRSVSYIYASICGTLSTLGTGSFTVEGHSVFILLTVTCSLSGKSCSEQDARWLFIDDWNKRVHLLLFMNTKCTFLCATFIIIIVIVLQLFHPVCECHFSTSSLFPDVIAYLTSKLHSWTVMVWTIATAEEETWNDWQHCDTQAASSAKKKKKWLENVNNTLHFGAMLTHSCRAHALHI